MVLFLLWIIISFWHYSQGKAKTYPSEMEKVAQDEIRKTISEIASSIDDRDQTIDDEIKTLRTSIESVQNELTSQIQLMSVSFAPFQMHPY